MTLYTAVPSPIGELMLCGDEASLTALHLPGHWAKPAAGWRRDDARFAGIARQLATPWRLRCSSSALSLLQVVYESTIPRWYR